MKDIHESKDSVVIELMYQTTASIRADLLKSASAKDAFRADPQQATLYVEVSQLVRPATSLSSRNTTPRRRVPELDQERRSLKARM